MTVEHKHIAGLELAHKIIEPYSQWCAEALLRVIARAKAAPVVFTKRDTRVECDMCGEKLGTLRAQVHECGYTEAAPEPVQGGAVELPIVSGIGRDNDHPRAVVLYLRSEPTDDNLRAIMEAVRNQPSPDAEPIAWMLADAVGGSFLDFQSDDLLENQHRYGGRIVPLYTAPPSPADHIPGARKMVDAELLALLALLRRSVSCNDLHHEPTEYHMDAEPCKVLARIDAKLAELRKGGINAEGKIPCR